jgi:hypothetical protein
MPYSLDEVDVGATDSVMGQDKSMKKEGMGKCRDGGNKRR